MLLETKRVAERGIDEDDCFLPSTSYVLQRWVEDKPHSANIIIFRRRINV